MPHHATEEVVRLRIPGETRYLALVRTVVTTLARLVGFNDEDVDKIELAVDEACTNVMDHAYRQFSPKPPIEMVIHLSPTQFIVDVIDEGSTFDFAAHETPTFPDHWVAGHTRGVGLYLIKHCMDETRYERLPQNTNRLRLIKNLQPVA